MTAPVHELLFSAVDEPQPGPKWQAHFRRFWPAYHEWFLREGDAARPSYATCSRMLRKHMPQLAGLYERLVDLAGGGDAAARLLSLWCPTPYLAACSQAIWVRGAPALVRNYDYNPRLCDGIVLRSAWTGPPVIAMTDCLWGVLDGFNEAGLCTALAFGGRQVVGRGFGVPLVLRYVLETCRTVGEATEALRRIPVHMTYNVSLVDAAGGHATVFVAPDRPAAVRHQTAATNHQDRIEWRSYAEITETRRRQALLETRLADPSESLPRLIDRFLEPPLYRTTWDRRWGTLYTAAYEPRRSAVSYRWPDHVWHQSMDGFAEGEYLSRYAAAARAVP